MLDEISEGLSQGARTALAYAALLPHGEVPWEWLKELTVTEHPALAVPTADDPDPWTAVRAQLETRLLLVPTDNPDLAGCDELVAEAFAAEESSERQRRDNVLAGFLARFARGVGAVPRRDWEYSVLAHASRPRATHPALAADLANAVTVLARFVRDGSVLSISLDLCRHQRQLVEDDPVSLTAARDLAVLLDHAAELQEHTDPAAALAAYTEALDLRRLLVEAQPDDPRALRDLTISLDYVGGLQESTDPRAALVAYTEALAIRRRLVELQPRDLRAVEELAIMMGRLAAHPGTTVPAAVPLLRERRLLYQALFMRNRSMRSVWDAAVAAAEFARLLDLRPDLGNSSAAWLECALATRGLRDVGILEDAVEELHAEAMSHQPAQEDQAG